MLKNRNKIKIENINTEADHATEIIESIPITVNHHIGNHPKEIDPIDLIIPVAAAEDPADHQEAGTHHIDHHHAIVIDHEMVKNTINIDTIVIHDQNQHHVIHETEQNHHTEETHHVEQETKIYDVIAVATKDIKHPIVAQHIIK